jgi:hypothetical protein
MSQTSAIDLHKIFDIKSVNPYQREDKKYYRLTPPQSQNQKTKFSLMISLTWFLCFPEESSEIQRAYPSFAFRN